MTFLMSKIIKSIYNRFCIFWFQSNGDPETSPKRELVRSKSLTNITNTLSQQQTVEQEELKSDNSGPNTLHSQQLSNVGLYH
jgi:hypothetical protein